MVLAQMGVSANQLTVGWIILGVVGVLTLGSGSYGARVAGAVLVEISYLFDYVDGEVARLQGRTSSLGVLLDLAGHGVIKSALFLAIGYGVFSWTHSSALLILAFLACVGVISGYMTPHFAAEAFPASGSSQFDGAANPAGGPSLKRVLRLLAAQGAYAFESAGIYLLVLIGAVVDRLEWVVIFYGVFGPLWFVYRLAKYRP
ncbi:MAG: CDP-alcohol phosphatidyltransferase family protein [Terriglobales bacterium]